MEFDESLVHSKADLKNISIGDLKQIHQRNSEEAEKYTQLLLANSSNKTQKTKAKKAIKDIKFKLSFYQNKEIQEWHTLHPEHKDDADEISSEDDVSPEELLKHISEIELNKEPAPVANDTLRPQKKNRQKERKMRKQAELDEQRRQAELEASQLPDFKSLERENLTAKCDEMNVVQEEIKADGNCLFYSVVNQLKARHSGDLFDTYKLPSNFPNVRTIPHRFLIHDLYDFDEYCTMMKDTSAWGGEVELSIISEIFRCKIFVLQQDTSFKIGNNELPNPDLKLVYYKHTLALGEHYGSLIDK
ncbi:unnamed protein product [Hanseniaspora opuntiae]